MQENSAVQQKLSLMIPNMQENSAVQQKSSLNDLKQINKCNNIAYSLYRM